MAGGNAGRVRTILDAVNQTIDEYRLWIDSETSIEPATAMADYLDHLQAVYDTGDIPNAVREVMPRVGVLLEEWRRYNEFGQHNEGVPIGSFHGAMRGLIDSLPDVNTKPRKLIESVQSLRETKVPDRQIALMFARRLTLPNGERGFEGPFWGPDGLTVLKTEIDAEQATQGSVLTWEGEKREYWVPPWDEADQAARAARERERLSRVSERAVEKQESEKRRLYEPTDAEILDYLRGDGKGSGGFVSQVKKNWRGCTKTLDEIQSLANKAGILPASDDDPVTRESATGAPLVDPPIDPTVTADGEPESGGFDRDAFKSYVLVLAHTMGSFAQKPESTAPEVDAAIREAGDWPNDQFSGGLVAALIREERKRVNAKAEEATA